MFKIITVYHPDHEKYLGHIGATLLGGYPEIVTWLRARSTDGYGAAKKNEIIQSCDDDDILIFLDADDYLAGGALKHIDQCFRHFKADVVYGDCYFDTGKRFLYGGSEKFRHTKLIQNNFIWHSGTAVRGSVAKQGKWLPIPWGRDWLYWISLIWATENWYYTERPLSVIRTYSSTRTFKKWNIPIVRKLIRMRHERIARQEINKLLEAHQ